MVTMKSNSKTFIFYILLLAVVLMASTALLNSKKSEPLVYSDIADLFEDGKVRIFTIDDDYNLTLSVRNDKPELAGDKKNDKIVTYRILDYTLFRENILERLVLGENGQYATGVIEEYDLIEPEIIPWWVGFVPSLLVILILGGFVIYFLNMTNKAGGKASGFGRSKAKLAIPDKNRIRFSDVAGADEEKEELEEVVEFLKSPARFSALGAKIPRGVLLVGPPGTGKTLLAKAVAGEAGVPFYSISGSDFVEMYVGVGASRVRDLFDNAKRHPASIIFIDEIDAVGRHRGAGLGGGHDEREQTLNQLLVEMDGFNGNDGVIVIAATNRPDILDPALLRPGRFDRQVTVNYPDLAGREAILKVHSKGKPFASDVDLRRVAQTTVGFTGADLANLLNEAALIAARKRKALIGMNDIEEASLKVIVGMPKKSMRITEEEKLKTAYHEAGHAVVAYHLPTADPVTLISITPSSKGALGFTLTPPAEDKHSLYRNAMKEEIAMLLGGRVAEAITFNDISAGASNDIQRATSVARNMVTRFGMSDELGPILYGSEHSSSEVFLGRDFSSEKNYSEETAAKIDSEIKRIVNEGYMTAEKILKENKDKLKFIAEFLVRNEAMDDKQFELTMKGNPTFEELEELTAEKRRISEEENEARRKAIAEEEAEKERQRKEAEAKGETPDSSVSLENGPLKEAWSMPAAPAKEEPENSSDTSESPEEKGEDK